MAKTAAERKREQRERDKKKPSAAKEVRLDTTIFLTTAWKIEMYADHHGLTKGEVIDRAMQVFMATLRDEERVAMEGRFLQKQREEKARQMKADYRTLPLPFDTQVGVTGHAPN